MSKVTCFENTLEGARAKARPHYSYNYGKTVLPNMEIASIGNSRIVIRSTRSCWHYNRPKRLPIAESAAPVWDSHLREALFIYLDRRKGGMRSKDNST